MENSWLNMIVCHCGDKKLSLFLRSKKDIDMPTVFEIFGLRFFFFSEDHDPIHVHVVRGDDEAKIAVVPEIELVYNHGLKAQDVKRALKLVKMYKEEIIAAWNEYHD